MKKTIKKIIIFLPIIVFLYFLAVIPNNVLAQTANLGLDDAQKNIGLGGGNLTLMIARVIRMFMGFLGIVTVGFVVYAGFLWMTAGGNEENVTKAKKMMVNAAIGLGIILSSFAIASFVISALVSATGFSGSGGQNSGGSGSSSGGGIGGYTEGMSVVMPGSTKAGFVAEFDLYFYKNFGSPAYPRLSTVVNGQTLKIMQGEKTLDVDIIREGNMLRLRSKEVCPKNKKNTPFCFTNDSTFTINLIGGFAGIEDDDGTPLECTNNNPCDAIIKTGNIDDSTAPSGSISYLQQIGGVGAQFYTGSGIPVESKFTMYGNANDNTEVKHVIVYKDGEEYIVVSPKLIDGYFPSSATISHPWSTANEKVFSGHKIILEIEDTSGNIGKSAEFKYTSTGQFCSDGKQNTPTTKPPGDETGVDCGGKECLSCIGGGCTSNDQCQSGKCNLVTKTCIQDPIIMGVFENNGAPGNYVTIVGKGFGDTQGNGFVLFGFGGITKQGEIPQCGSVPMWTDTQIVVKIPAGATNGPIKVERNDGKFDFTFDTNGPKLDDFIINDIARPGISCISPKEGYFGTNLLISGANFGATQLAETKLTIGGIPVAPKQWSNNKIIGAIPSITAGKQSVQIVSQNTASNPFMITVKDVSQDSQPVIASISPIQAGPGSTVTILGSGFGSKKGTVFFGELLGDFGFGTACGNNQWSNNYIVVKVPSNAQKGKINVNIERVEPTIKSKSIEFTVTDSSPSPAICGITPNNGPIGTKVSVIGENFGEPGAITIGSAEGIVTKYDSWTQIKVSNAVVPSTAITGELKLSTKQNIQSNSIPFLVNNCVESGCSSIGTKCCSTGGQKGVCVAQSDVCVGDDGKPHGKYEWIFATGKIPVIPSLVYQCGVGLTPSPAPWSDRNGGNNVCVNAKVSGVFNIAVSALSYGTSVVLEKCQEKDGNACGTATKIESTLSQALEAGLGFEIIPLQQLESNTTYRVTLSNTITSKEKTGDGKYVPMAKDTACPKPSSLSGSPSACFTFKTQNSGEICQIKDVLITPSNWTSENLGAVKLKPPLTDDLLYVASGLGEDKCVLLNTNDGPWQWNIASDPNPISLTLKEGGSTHLKKVDALKEHPFGKSAIIAAEYLNPSGSAVTGNAKISIALAKPKVLSVYPSCNKACINGAIGAIFNTKMKASSFSTGVFLYQCNDESCKTLLAPISTGFPIEKQLDDGTYEYTFNFSTTLKQSVWYRVIFKGGENGVISSSGATLSEPNYGNDYSWKFRTRDEDKPCVISQVDVLPVEATVKAIFQTASYFAQPRTAPDECDAKGQKLTPWSYGWKWNSEKSEVAIVSNKDFGEGVKYCTNSCTLAGSTAVPAVCGDGVVQKSHEECDGGVLCSSSCLNLGTKAVKDGGTCGNADIKDPKYKAGNNNPWIESGEDCDDGNNISGDGCGENCINEGSFFGLSSCGNKDKGDGEDCDDGNSQAGDGCNGQCLKEGSPKYNPACAGLTKYSSDSLKAECAGNVYFAICGNKQVEAGENCDDGNTKSGDGCSAVCLNESFKTLEPTALCGNGVIDQSANEQCDPPKNTDGLVDPVQIATAIGQGQVTDSIQQTKIKATPIEKNVSNSASGSGLFKLQCGFITDTDCVAANNGSLEFGVAKNSCCSQHPKIVASYPENGSNKVCTNTSIWIETDRELDSATLTGNVGLFVYHSAVPGGTCSGDKGAPIYISFNDTQSFFGFSGLLKKVALTITKFITGTSVKAGGYYCPALIEGKTSAVSSKGKTRVSFVQKKLLEKNIQYHFAIKGGINGVKSTDGVAFKEGWNAISFTTGKEFCALNKVSINTNYLLISKAQQTETLLATGLTKEGAEVNSIEGVYDWTWKWAKSHEQSEGIVVYPSSIEEETAGTTPISITGTQIVRATDKNGGVDVTATATIVNDAASGTKGKTFSDVSRVEVFICENPWPSLSNNNGRFEDSASAQYSNEFGQNFSLAGGAQTALYTNFATRYCMDQGQSNDKTDDLPKIQPIIIGDPPNPDFTIKEFFFSPVNNEGNKINKDVIGIRVEKNFEHLPLLEWYKARGFTGTPSQTSVDGFEALQDGRTVYVSAINAEGSTSQVQALRTNVYVLSYNQGADASTLAIFKQILENFKLMVNIQSSGLCFGDKNVITTAVGQREKDEKILASSKACYSDLDCKGEVSDFSTTPRCDAVKDKALRDLRRISDFRGMENALNNYYTKNNTYPTLESGTYLEGKTVSVWGSWQSSLGNALGTSIHVDPLNTLSVCIDKDADQTSCWNALTGTYQCALGSYVYEYNVSGGGKSYILKSDFELSRTLWKNNELLNQNWITDNVCTGAIMSASSTNVCGNKIVEAGENCDPPGATFEEETIENGKLTLVNLKCSQSCQKQLQTVFEKSACGNGVVDSVFNEICDDGKKNGIYGFCNSSCTADVKCGDGILQSANSTPQGPELCELKRCEKDDSKTCITDSNCDVPSAVLSPTHNCQATAIDGKYNCGSCMKKNSVYALAQKDSCNWDCRSFGAYCGDGIVNGPEQCDVGDDGGPLTLDCTQANGSIGVKKGSCNSDCTFEDDPSTQPCENLPPVSGNIIPVTAEGCGDTKIDTAKGETCDLGNKNGSLCVAEYGGNCSYCTAPSGFESGCVQKTLTGGYCGDKILNGPEICDGIQFTKSAKELCIGFGFDYGTPACINQCSSVTKDNGNCKKCGLASQINSNDKFDIIGETVIPTKPSGKEKTSASDDYPQTVTLFYDNKSTKKIINKYKNSSIFEAYIDKTIIDNTQMCTSYYLVFEKKGYVGDKSITFAGDGLDRFIRGYHFNLNFLENNRFGIVTEWDSNLKDIDVEIKIVPIEGTELVLNKKTPKPNDCDSVTCLKNNNINIATLDRIDDKITGFETIRINPTQSGDFRLNNNAGLKTKTYYVLKVIDNSKASENNFNKAKSVVNVKTYNSSGNKAIYEYPKNKFNHGYNGNSYESKNIELILDNIVMYELENNAFYLIFETSEDGKELIKL